MKDALHKDMVAIRAKLKLRLPYYKEVSSRVGGWVDKARNFTCEKNTKTVCRGAFQRLCQMVDDPAPRAEAKVRSRLCLSSPFCLIISPLLPKSSVFMMPVEEVSVFYTVSLDVKEAYQTVSTSTAPPPPTLHLPTLTYPHIYT